MSHHPAPTPMGILEELNGRLSKTARAVIIRLARKIADGYEGEVTVLVMKGGGIRSVTWKQIETGEEIREELG